MKVEELEKLAEELYPKKWEELIRKAFIKGYQKREEEINGVVNGDLIPKQKRELSFDLEEEEKECKQCNGTGTIIMEELKVIGLDGELEWDFEVPVSCGCEVNEY